MGFPAGTTQGENWSTAYVLRQDSKIPRRVQEDVNVLVKIPVLCTLDEGYCQPQSPGSIHGWAHMTT